MYNTTRTGFSFVLLLRVGLGLFISGGRRGVNERESRGYVQIKIDREKHARRPNGSRFKAEHMIEAEKDPYDKHPGQYLMTNLIGLTIRRKRIRSSKLRT